MKRVQSLVAGFFFCILMAVQPAMAESVTLAELRAQTPVTVTLELPGADGVPTPTQVPVIFPETEHMDVQNMRLMQLDKTAMLAKYTAVEDIPLGPDGHHEFFCFFRFAPKGKTKIFNEIQAGCYLYQNRMPDANDMPWERPAEKLRELIAACGWKADIRVTWQAATSRGYVSHDKLGTTSRGDAYVVMVFSDKNPAKGYNKGYYKLQMSQYLNGVRIFGSGKGYGFADRSREAEDGAYTSGQELSMNILSEEDFGIYMEILETEQIIHPEVALAPFQTVLQTLQNRIGEGKLKTVYSIELGYASLESAQNMLLDAGDRRWLLVPAWCVYGFDTKDDPARAADGYTVPTAQEYWESGNRYQLWINAVTGEVMANGLDEVRKMTSGQ